jgi:hypothetical protein
MRTFTCRSTFLYGSLSRINKRGVALTYLQQYSNLINGRFKKTWFVLVQFMNTLVFFRETVIHCDYVTEIGVHYTI